ncbi:hypothetical protein ZIOFF_049346 [Zingiber officinale]|uniref:Disease resistance R13L4/SHOC-2-like LRR domain-containing protein n=1 Tax=Zingiber officinale TaxID=94328 RepID=A0A8J5G1I6_ZINOF|nr:hypothetical protein ZIOFF_049346 [Zingiber officinale]
MATAWRSRLRFRERWPLQYYRCYYQLPADLVMLCWLIMMAFLLVEEAQGDDCCAWNGVVCHNRTGRVRVAELNLQNPNGTEEETTLRGELLHPSLLSLTHLRNLNLRFNDFERTQIPPLVGSLHKLSYLDLSWSNLSGIIPPHLGNLTNLRHLDLSTSNLGGTIPPHLGNLTNLHHLDLSWSKFSGTIPPHLENLTNLHHLDLSDCNFSGTIPPHLGNLTNLHHLDLSDNSNLYFPKDGHSLDWLSGLSSLIYLDMSFLDLSNASHNFLSTINMLPSLQQLNLCFCSISNIPLSLNFHLNLTSLTTLDLSGNIFTSSFPNWLWNLTSLSSLQLKESQIGGKLPIEIGNLISITYLDLSLNLLSGPLPDTLSKLKHLTYLDLSYNLLGNSLPMGIMNLSSLSTLRLINWSIPHSFGNFSTMISTSNEQLPSFEVLEMGQDTYPIYSGSESITLITKGDQFTFSSILYLVKSIDLSNNELIDEIYEEFRYLAGLHALNLSRNYFKGTR